MSSENKYDDELRLPTFEEELARLKLEMEAKIREEMEAKLRAEMEVRIRKEMQDEASLLHHKIKQQISKNMEMLSKIMDRFTQITGNFPCDMSKIRQVLLSFIETLVVDILDVYVISKTIVETNEQPAWDIVAFIICKDGVYGMDTRIKYKCPSSFVPRDPRRFYTFDEMLPSKSIQESILLSFCERPIKANTHMSNNYAANWVNSAIETFDGVISTIPGTHSGITIKLDPDRC